MSANKPPDKYGDWLVRKLGAGAFGTVHWLYNTIDKKAMAIKKCKAENMDTKERWKQEMRMIAKMNHPNVVAFIPIPEELTNEYPLQTSLGMEYCVHGDLRKFLYKPEHCCGLPEYHVRDVMCDVGSAIAYLHEQHNMHRDLKPENIVITDRQGCPGHYLFKVTDLGYAKELDQHSFALSFVGTFAYLAPEIIRGQGVPYGQLKYHSQVDYWSFGLVVFECITGIRPFNATQAQNKNDAHICHLPDDSGKARFLKHIPKPHHLNPYFEADVVPWIRLMLLLDEGKRGGENNEWYRQLMEKISPAKIPYVKVLDVRSMEVKTFPLDVNAMPQTVLRKIEKELNISQTDQFLLMEGGGSPIATKRILLQMRENSPKLSVPEESILYTFGKSNEEWPVYKCKNSAQTARYLDNEDAVLADYGIKRLFHILLHDTLCNIKVGDIFRRALFALVGKVDKMSKQLEDLCNSFLRASEKTVGMVELFMVSLEKDIASYGEQDNASGICVTEEFTKSGEDSRSLVREWEGYLTEAGLLLKEASEEIGERIKRYPNLWILLNNISIEFNKLTDIHNDTTRFYSTFKSLIKASERGPQSNEAQKLKLREFKVKHWLKAKEFVEEVLKPKGRLRSLMRFLIDHHTRLESIYFRMMDKKQRMASIQDHIRDKQRDRQHMLWNMIQYMKDVYNTAVQYPIDEHPEQELAQEFNNLHLFTQGFINDPDLCSMINLCNEDLQSSHTAVGSAYLSDPTACNPKSELPAVTEASPNEKETESDVPKVSEDKLAATVDVSSPEQTSTSDQAIETLS